MFWKSRIVELLKAPAVVEALTDEPFQVLNEWNGHLFEKVKAPVDDGITRNMDDASVLFTSFELAYQKRVWEGSNVPDEIGKSSFRRGELLVWMYAGLVLPREVGLRTLRDSLETQKHTPEYKLSAFYADKDTPAHKMRLGAAHALFEIKEYETIFYSGPVADREKWKHEITTPNEVVELMAFMSFDLLMSAFVGRSPSEVFITSEL